MNVRNLKAKSVPTTQFAMNPSPEIKRSKFPIRQGCTTAFNFGALVPIYWYDVLPGDHWNAKITAACRTSVPIAPILDNWHLEFFAFFTPYRILWTNFVKMMGEQDNPTDSIAYTVPRCVSPAGGFPVGTIFDFFGLPTAGQVLGGNTVSVSALPLRAYNKIWNQWFRDENLNTSRPNNMGDGPDNQADYFMMGRNKRHDYFTSCLPWPQKGNTASALPLGIRAPVIANTVSATSSTPRFTPVGDSAFRVMRGTSGSPTVTYGANPTATGDVQWTPGLRIGTDAGEPNTGLIADLTTATAATINQLRTAITLQQLLERDARGGTRYKEMIYSHFKVVSPDARQDRPEYIGGGGMPIIVNAVPQTGQTGLTGGTTPLGTLGATGYALGTAGFSYAATEHGCIIILANARADLRYSQGLDRAWSRLTRYDFFLPVLDGLGEQPVLNKEIYADGSAADDNVFGYIPRWSEYRHFPSKITGLMRPRSAGNIAYWNSSENFATLPALNSSFIGDNSATVTQRNFAGGALSLGQQVFGDFMVQGAVARSMSAFGVPGLTRL